ncbi:unnamed protein product [Acanthosepion pharaonis]|uniref:Uncharacterized protein n=1 Tax=Acanthosepion pharaonis TaxID=158019 RepID=A0A812E396_ACAPH|nr:unnamed protein product [Sepia pharaonis]
MITYLLYSVLFFFFLYQCPFFSRHKHNFTHCPAVTEVYTFFLTLFRLFLSFLFFYRQLGFQPDLLQQECTLSSSLWFSFFFPSSLHNSAYNRGIHFVFSFLSSHNSTCNRGIYFLPLSGYPLSLRTTCFSLLLTYHTAPLSLSLPHIILTLTLHIYLPLSLSHIYPALSYIHLPASDYFASLFLSTCLTISSYLSLSTCLYFCLSLTVPI